MTELQERLMDFSVIYLAGVVIMTVLAAIAFALGWVLDRPWVQIFILTLTVFFAWSLLGCVAPRPACMSGFELGVNGGQSSGRQFGDRYTEDTVGGHATVYFDMTGACAQEEGDAL